MHDGLERMESSERLHAGRAVLLCLQALMLLPCPIVATAATLTVSQDGLSAYATIQACANAAQSGDTCLILAGTYAEHPSTVRPNVTFKAAGQVIVQGFRIRHANITIQGFEITKYAVGLDQAHIRVEPEAHGCQILDNTIRDGIYVTSTAFSFDGPTKTITNPAGGFVAAGFTPGASIYITSDINSQIKNHDNTKLLAPSYAYETKWVRGVTDTTLTLDQSNTLFIEGPVPSTIYVNSAEKNGMWGILFISSSTRGDADDCVIAGNAFRNLAGKAIALLGDRHRVEGNTFERMNGWRLITFNGNDHIIRGNLLRDSPRWPGFSLPKTTLAALGSGSWDMYDVIFASFAGQADRVLIEKNWIEGLDAQFSNIAAQGATGLTMQHNVFISYELQGNISRPDTQLQHNTFYKAGYRSPYAFILGQSNVHGNPIGSVIQHNAFIDSAGGFSTNGADGKPTPGVTAIHNLVIGTDPGVQDISNPLGPDGVPFTRDDGLKPKPGSMLCDQGGVDIGAYSCDPAKVFADDVTAPATPVNLRITGP